MNRSITSKNFSFVKFSALFCLLFACPPSAVLAAEDPGESVFKRLIDTPEEGWKRLNDHFLNGREKSLNTLSSLYAFKFSKDARFLVVKGTLESLEFYDSRKNSQATSSFDRASRTTPESLYQQAATFALPILHGDKELAKSYNQLEALVDKNPQETPLRLLFATLSYKISTEEMEEMTRDKNEIIQLSLYHYRACLKAWSQGDGGAKINANIVALLDSRGSIEEELRHRLIVDKHDPNPKNSGEIGLSLSLTAKAQEGKEKLDQLLKDHPKNRYTHEFRLLYFKYLDQTQEAYNACQAGLTHQEKSSTFLENAGQLEEKLGKPADAEKSYAKALEANKEKSISRRRLLYLYEKRGAYDEAWKLEQKIPKNPENKLSKNVFFRAIEQNRVKEVESLLQANPELISQIDPDVVDQTPLMKATQWGATQVALLLMERGANLQTLDRDQCNVAHYACYHGRTFLLEKFLEQGANPWQINRLTNTAALGGVSNYHPECIQPIIKFFPVEKYRNEYTKVFIRCAVWNDLENMKALHQQGIGFDQADPETGQTALMSSTRWQQRRIIHYLLMSGASLNALDKKAQNALHYVFENKELTPNIEVYRWLNGKGADSAQKSQEGKTPTDLLSQSIAKKFFE